MTALVQRDDQLAESAYVRVVPARAQSGDWRSVGQALTQSITEREIDPVVELYASLGDAIGLGINLLGAGLFSQTGSRESKSRERSGRVSNSCSTRLIHSLIAWFFIWRRSCSPAFHG